MAGPILKKENKMEPITATVVSAVAPQEASIKGTFTTVIEVANILANVLIATAHVGTAVLWIYLLWSGNKKIEQEKKEG